MQVYNSSVTTPSQQHLIKTQDYKSWSTTITAKKYSFNKLEQMQAALTQAKML
jgi:hypothetical protein